MTGSRFISIIDRVISVRLKAMYGSIPSYIMTKLAFIKRMYSEYKPFTGESGFVTTEAPSKLNKCVLKKISS